ncbi:MAG: glycine--tRNA ligase, partial [Gemmatimonadales bacterium]
PLIECKNCHRRFRADDITGDQCPICGVKNQFTEPRMFNLMFRTFMGPVEEEAAQIYLRPETAQGIYVNFLNVMHSSRQKIPFGIAQIGKAFRNEITPGNFIFRTREFEQMEMQFFVKPGTDTEWFDYWRNERLEWMKSLGIRPERLRLERHTREELAHYAYDAYDIQYEFPFGWQEFEGIHNRTDYDLTAHQKRSGKKLEYFDQVANQRYIPYIIETSGGVDRLVLVLLADAYREEEVEGETRVVLGLQPRLAPIKVAVFALVKKDGMPEVSQRIYQDLRSLYPAFHDESGSIGRRYRRQDEAGTPFCVTVDGQTLEDDTVTVRDRDTLAQDRVATGKLRDYLVERIG